MNTYRNRNGRYASKKALVRREMRRLAMYFYSIVFFGLFSALMQPDTFTVYRSAQASTTGQYDPCGLRDVICDNEQNVVTAIQSVSDALGHEVTEETKKRIRYLYDRSVASQVPFNDAVKTIYCESRWTSAQSAVVNERGQEPSFGLAQIHLPSHRDVTKDQAMDAYFAIDFLITNWYTPRAIEDKMWYGYSRATGKCTNGLTINL